MLSTRFGVEIEMTGITREKAASITARILGGISRYVGGAYSAYEVSAPDGRCWKFMTDASIQTSAPGNMCAGRDYSTEFVTPILTYDQDIETLQEIIRELRKNGGVSNSSCGIHIHLDGAGHTAKSIRNFANIVYNRGDLLYGALDIKPERAHYCQKLDRRLMEAFNKKDPGKLTLGQLETIWYEIYYDGRGRCQHYHNSRYHFLNLHSFFNGHGTVELRGFNSTLHAGVIRSYIVLALAMNHQALTAPMTKRKMAETTKEAMENWLRQMGVTGTQFKNCVEHLCKNLKKSEKAA